MKQLTWHYASYTRGYVHFMLKESNCFYFPGFNLFVGDGMLWQFRPPNLIFKQEHSEGGVKVL